MWSGDQGCTQQNRFRKLYDVEITEVAFKRHDISDDLWKKIELHLPGQTERWDGIAIDNRKFFNAVMWIIRTGAPWRGLPPEYDRCRNMYRRFIRWHDKGVWKKQLAIIIEEPLLSKTNREVFISSNNHAESDMVGENGISF